jgi:hypothetical protein
MYTPALICVAISRQEVGCQIVLHFDLYFFRLSPASFVQHGLPPSQMPVRHAPTSTARPVVPHLLSRSSLMHFLGPYMRDEYFRSLAPPLLLPARLVGQHRSTLGRAAHALRRVECDHVPCLATTQTLSLGASEVNTASTARGLRIRRIVPTGDAEAEDASFEADGARADSLAMS